MPDEQLRGEKLRVSFREQHACLSKVCNSLLSLWGSQSNQLFRVRHVVQALQKPKKPESAVVELASAHNADEINIPPSPSPERRIRCETVLPSSDVAGRRCHRDDSPKRIRPWHSRASSAAGTSELQGRQWRHACFDSVARRHRCVRPGGGRNL